MEFIESLNPEFFKETNNLKLFMGVFSASFLCFFVIYYTFDFVLDEILAVKIFREMKQ